jgi:putative ABC transport system permease protein
VLLGLGNGLQNAVEQNFADDAVNSIWIRAGDTSIAHEGMPTGRKVMFNNHDIDAIRDLRESDKVTGRFYVGGNRFNSQITAQVGHKIRSYDLRCVNPDHTYLENTIMKTGRFINAVDIDDKRKIAVIGEPIAEFMFEGEDPIGQEIALNGVSFRVVGTFNDEGEQGEAEMIYIPITTGQLVFNGSDKVNQVMFTLQPDITPAESVDIAQKAVDRLAAAHRFDPNDQQAAWIRNNAENYDNFLKLFRMIAWFVSIMAGCTLLAGIIGISNIMMIVVRERTREIGIRKALGASATNIVTSIVQESVVLTAAAGYLGLVAGIGLLALIDKAVGGAKGGFLHDPSVSLTVAIGATVVLVIAGALAGLFPALSAARVNPIEALRDE